MPSSCINNKPPQHTVYLSSPSSLTNEQHAHSLMMISKAYSAGLIPSDCGQQLNLSVSSSSSSSTTTTTESSQKISSKHNGLERSKAREKISQKNFKNEKIPKRDKSEREECEKRVGDEDDGDDDDEDDLSYSNSESSDIDE